MDGRRYLILDVFAGRALEGNPLAVVLDAGGLDLQAMQRITREFNLSETVFVLPAERPGNAARIRIFAPEYEMPFAGHPTVGTAIALALERHMADGAELVLEENIGPVRCVVGRHGAVHRATFDLPKLSEPVAFAADREHVAAALGLTASDIGFAGHGPAAWSAGVPYVTVPVRDVEALGRVRFDLARWQALAPTRDNGVHASAYVYCRGSGRADFRARMLVAASPTYEDPATGSAAAAFTGQVMACDRPGDGSHAIRIAQGVEMGRPSLIEVVIDVDNGHAIGATIGGEAVVVARGELYA